MHAWRRIVTSQRRIVTSQSPILAPHDLQPESKQDKKKLQQLLEVHDQHGHCNG